MDDLIDAINGYLFTLVALTLLAPMLLIHSARILRSKTPPEDLGEL
jgi:hypothetical protein